MNTEYFVGESLTLAASMLPDPDTCLGCRFGSAFAVELGEEWVASSEHF